MPDEKELEGNIDLVNCRHPGVDPAVKKLVGLRNNWLAHRSPATVLLPKEPAILDALSWQEVEHLLELSIRLVNHYGSLFKAVSNSTQIIGHNDFRYVLEAVRKGLRQNDEAIARLIESASEVEGTII
jgi:hypothetical protein